MLIKRSKSCRDSMRQSVGSGIQCDGATLNISPFVSTTNSMAILIMNTTASQFMITAITSGLVDPETGIDGPDGIPDRCGHVLYVKQMRTGYRQNFSTNAGITATFSSAFGLGPYKPVRTLNVSRWRYTNSAQLANRRLDYELARLKNCATALREGYGWKPDSPFYPILCRCDSQAEANRRAHPPNYLPRARLRSRMA